MPPTTRTAASPPSAGCWTVWPRRCGSMATPRCCSAASTPAPCGATARCWSMSPERPCSSSSRPVSADRDQEPVPVGRYAVLALVAVLLLLGITLLVRPFIFSLADPRDDARYPLLSVGEADKGPRSVEIVLNDRHGFPGEVVRDELVGYTVVVAPLPGQGGYSVVGAWS